MTMTEEARRQFQAEKAGYWAMREKLLQQHPGKWVAVVDGQLVASADSKSRALAEAFQRTKSRVGYVNCVGHEEAVLRKRIRHAVKGRYETDYDPAMPLVMAALADPFGTSRTEAEFVVDTGADLTVLCGGTASLLNLQDLAWDEAEVSGIGAQPERRDLYLVTVELAGCPITTTVDCRDDMGEDLLGRDVTNAFELTLCAKRNLVDFRWVAEA